MDNRGFLRPDKSIVGGQPRRLAHLQTRCFIQRLIDGGWGYPSDVLPVPFRRGAQTGSINSDLIQRRPGDKSCPGRRQVFEIEVIKQSDTEVQSQKSLAQFQSSRTSRYFTVELILGSKLLKSWMKCGIAALALLLGIEAAPGEGKVLVVPDQYQTIQAAIDAASAGDSVFIKGGTFDEALTLKSDVELVGAGRDQTTIRANALEAPAAGGSNLKNVSIQCINFEHFGSSNSSNRDNGKAIIKFENSTVNFVLNRVQGSPADGINATDGSIAVADCEIIHNQWAGVCVSDDARIYLYNNTITQNGEGVQIYNGSRGTIQQNTISYSKTNGLVTNDASPRVVLNRCEANTVGIRVGGGGNPVVEYNNCLKNTDCGILAADKTTRPTIRSNSADWNGRFGIWVEEATIPAEFSGNSASKNSVNNIMRRGYWRY